MTTSVASHSRLKQEIPLLGDSLVKGDVALATEGCLFPEEKMSACRQKGRGELARP